MHTNPYKDLTEIESLVHRFLNKTLPVAEWTHAAHLTVGLWFVSTYGLPEATRKMSDCIYTYNEAAGVQNTDTGGYHETITQFWLWLLGAYWQRVQGHLSLLAACNHLLASPLSDRAAFLKFYSRELLFSVRARRTYVQPDLQPLAIDRIG